MLEWLTSLGSAGAFVARHWDVLAFYTIATILIIIFRKKFEFQGIVGLLKTQFGVKFMTQTGARHPKFWDKIGYVAIFIGYLGMAFITVYLVWGLYALFFIPDAPPALSPVIPGVQIPGVPIVFPLWYTLGALFVAILVHEAMHGIFSSAYNIKIKSSGFAFIGPIPGAFVEPEEKEMSKRPRRQQLAIVAGGPFANVVMAIIAFGLVFAVGSSLDNMVVHQGVSYGELQEGSGAQNAGMPPNSIITMIDGQEINRLRDLSGALAEKIPGQDVNIIVSGNEYLVTLGEAAQNPTQPMIGVLGVKEATTLKNPSMTWLFGGLSILLTLLIWIYIISLGIGVANLIPVFMIDGGRMMLLTLEAYLPKETAMKIWTRSGFVILGLVIVLVFVPIIKAIF